MNWLETLRSRLFDRGDEAETLDSATEALVARARALPEELEPSRDLWSGIENRVSGRVGAPEPSPWSLAVLFPRPLAAAAVGIMLVATTAVSVAWFLSSPVDMENAVDVAAVARQLRERDGVADVHRNIVAILDAHRADLPPETLAILDENLRSIDRAIAEIHFALESNPNHHALSFMLAEAYRSEAELLERLEWWLQSSSEATS
jgi:hypothetical protein